MARQDNLWKTVLAVLALTVAMLLGAMAAVALAADPAPAPAPTLLLPTEQIWAFAAGGLVPLLTYVINHWAPWVSEPVKAFVFVLGAAVAGGITQAIDVGNVGFNDQTLQFVLSAIFAAVVAHAGIYTRGGINTRLGGGSNR